MKKRKWYSLIDKVYSLPNLLESWYEVKANKGRGGVDKESIEEFEGNLNQNLKELHRLLKEKRYTPSPVRQVLIPKSNSEDLRPLGIPTIRDRVIQQAIKRIIEPIFEAKFKEVSYGYRPKRGTREAIQKCNEYIDSGYRWVVDADIKSFFDTVNHKLMMKALNEEIADGTLLDLIEKFLKSGVRKDGRIDATYEGVPQGGVISPLLANIYLHYFDGVMHERGYRLVRYCDDFVIFTKFGRKAERALEVTKQILEEKLLLKLHPQKTRIVHANYDGFEFLGCLFKSGYIRPKDKSIESFKDKVRHITRRQQPKSLDMIIERLNPVVRGWGNYFRYGNVKTLYQRLDEWTRMRLRSFLEKKRAVTHQNKRISNWRLKSQGLVLLQELLPIPFPVMGQLKRKAVYGKTVRTV
ncbi:MAG: group II intron reverse transcriptase/maturase [Candidatus Omnitrophica bacterium]|nr:group II intron reverse transcriptase/maturase [Patescibacteria group bacterium]MBU4457874.1 group II intron reverse transcriptase/maturase [Candidatus Omnitrophota bacterium]